MSNYEQMLQEHESIKAELKALEGLDDVAELHARLGSLRATLERHFAHEEEGGYLTIVTEPRPGLSPRVEALQQQHQEILDMLARAIELGAESDELLGLAKSVAETLAQHEADENELVYKAINEDIGGAD